MRKFFGILVWYLFTAFKIVVLIWHNILPSDNRFFRYFKIKAENFVFFSPRVYKVTYIRKEVKNSTEQVRLFTKDMVRLHATYLAPQENKPTVIYFHGQSENITKWQDSLLFLKKLGYGALFLSFRGHYKSAGRPSEQGVYTDAQTAVEYLLNKGIKEEDIILWGRSLGSVTAVETALKYKVKGLIIESGILDITTAALSVFKRYINLFHLQIFGNFIIDLIKSANFIQKFDNKEKISKLNLPVLIVHAKNDCKIEYTQAQELYNQCPSARLVLAEDGSHDRTDWAFGYIEEFLGEI